MVGFGSTLGTTSMSIPDIPCFAPTVASQATFSDAGTGYHAREFGMDRESGSGNASRSAFGILQVQEVHMRLVMAKRRRTNVNTPNGAIDRVLHLPPLAGVHTFSPPTLQRMWTPRIIHAIMRPLLHLRLFCFCIPVDDGNIGMSTGSYIGSSASFFMGLRTSGYAGEGKGSFEFSLLGPGFRVDCVATLLPTRTTTSSQTTTTTTNRRRLYRHVYTRPPTHPPT